MLCYHWVAILDYLRADFVLMHKEYDLLALGLNFTFGRQQEIFAKGNNIPLVSVCLKASFYTSFFLMCVYDPEKDQVILLMILYRVSPTSLP